MIEAPLCGQNALSPQLLQEARLCSAVPKGLMPINPCRKLMGCALAETIDGPFKAEVITSENHGTVLMLWNTSADPKISRNLTSNQTFLKVRVTNRLVLQPNTDIFLAVTVGHLSCD